MSGPDLVVGAGNFSLRMVKARGPGLGRQPRTCQRKTRTLPFCGALQLAHTQEHLRDLWNVISLAERFTFSRGCWDMLGPPPLQKPRFWLLLSQCCPLSEQQGGHVQTQTRENTTKFQHVFGATDFVEPCPQCFDLAEGSQPGRGKLCSARQPTL